MPMISIRKFLEESQVQNSAAEGIDSLARAALAAYSSSLRALANCSGDICAAACKRVSAGVSKLADDLIVAAREDLIKDIEQSVRMELHEWSRETAAYYKSKAAEVR